MSHKPMGLHGLLQGYLYLVSPHRKDFSIIKTSQLFLFSEIVSIYCVNHTEHICG
jgi:hypothetical protein